MHHASERSFQLPAQLCPTACIRALLCTMPMTLTASVGFAQVFSQVQSLSGPLPWLCQSAGHSPSSFWDSSSPKKLPMASKHGMNSRRGPGPPTLCCPWHASPFSLLSKLLIEWSNPTIQQCGPKVGRHPHTTCGISKRPLRTGSELDETALCKLSLLSHHLYLFIVPRYHLLSAGSRVRLRWFPPSLTQYHPVAYLI